MRGEAYNLRGRVLEFETTSVLPRILEVASPKMVIYLNRELGLLTQGVEHRIWDGVQKDIGTVIQEGFIIKQSIRDVGVSGFHLRYIAAEACESEDIFKS